MSWFIAIYIGYHNATSLTMQQTSLSASLSVQCFLQLELLMLYSFIMAQAPDITMKIEGYLPTKKLTP